MSASVWRHPDVKVSAEAVADAEECLATQHRWDRVGIERTRGERNVVLYQIVWRCDRCSTVRTLLCDTQGWPYRNGHQYDHSPAFRQATRAEKSNGQTWKQAQRSQWLRGQR